MGSPCSPALCNMIVAVVEQCWVKSLRSMFVNHKHLHQPTSEQQAIFFATRYVDNRVLLIPQQYISLPPFRELVDPDFYQPPVKLDTEPANIFLGFAIHTSTATLSYDDKLQKADIMHPQSATTSSVLRSSIQARILRARRVCVPSTMADAAVAAIQHRYQAAGTGFSRSTENAAQPCLHCVLLSSAELPCDCALIARRICLSRVCLNNGHMPGPNQHSYRCMCESDTLAILRLGSAPACLFALRCSRGRAAMFLCSS